jgi:hypothetical protein
MSKKPPTRKRVCCRMCETAYLVPAGHVPDVPRCPDCCRRLRTQGQRKRREQARKDKLQQRCAECGGLLAPERTTARYCDSACRVKAWRAARRKK